jgi:hypothetical protein
MHIIIDAYNLIKRIYPNKVTSKVQIESCVETLKQYALLKNHHLTIVFDGGLVPWPTNQDSSSLCSLWWVGVGAKADDFIKKLLETKFKYHLLVSCDKELVLHAQDNKIPSIEVAFFWKFVEKAVEISKENRQKPVCFQKEFPPDDQTIDEVMHEFSLQTVIKDRSAQDNEIFALKKQLSKLEIQLYTIIKKL